jgi:hypothetical protein
MTISNIKALLILSLSFLITGLYAQKQVYIPSFITNEGIDINNPDSQWSYARSIETDNYIIFWEPGFGSDPSLATGGYRIDMEALKICAEKSFAVNVDSLRMVIKGSSLTDRYKQMIFLLYTLDWGAWGSGQDDMVGTLHVNPAAANIATVVAHEIGHSFQYMTGADERAGGFRYGFGPNASGGNGFWEQCANWQAFKVYPEEQFRAHDFNVYIRSNHLHILHETPRYANYFLPDFWAYKRGPHFMGRLWRESRRPEDPVEAYKRLNAITQEQFNDEMYEHAARLTTWDLPAIKSYGANYINSRAQVKMNLTDDNYWLIDPTVCPENYGYNSIKLNAPSQQTELTVSFRGQVGGDGFRANNIENSGWRFGFVALLEDGTRVYSPVGTARYTNGANPGATLSFICPDRCAKLWLVVSGAPQQHVRHAWDSDDTNDEHLPYEVQFTNTDLLGHYSTPIKDITLTYHLNFDPRTDYTSTPVAVNEGRICEAFAMPATEIVRLLGTSITYNAINLNGTLNPTSTAHAPGHWFASTGAPVAWGNNTYIFSEMNLGAMAFNIGQYPGACKVGDRVTIKQALVYTKSATETAQVTFIFNITIGNTAPISQKINLSAGWNLISANVHPEDSSIATLFNVLDVAEIKTMESFWRAGQPDYLNSLQSIAAGQGYLVNMNTAGTLTVTGTHCTGVLQYAPTGWQLIGCPYQTATPISGILGSNLWVIKNFDGFWMPNEAASSIENLEPGKAYFIK